MYLRHLSSAKNKIDHMVKICPIILSVVTTLFSCLGSSKNLKRNIIRIEVTTRSPDRIVDNRGETFVHDFYISYYGQYLLYELPYHKTYEINNEVIYDSVKYEFFICNHDTKAGYLLKNIGDSLKIKIKGDSILRTRAYYGSGDMTDAFAELKIKALDKLRIINAETIYKYTFDNNFYDSAYFYYCKDLTDIEFSFSRLLDSMYNSKLCKIQLFIKKDSSITSPELKGFFINSFEIRKTPVTNEGEIKNLFDKFIQDEKNKIK